MNLKEKLLGGFVGSALGDSIGQIAFSHDSSDSLIADIDQHSVLNYTDDTAMALGIAESIIINQGRINSEHLGKTFHENYLREPDRGYAIGPPTIFSLVEKQNLTYLQAASKLFDRQGSFGNGASMRIAPVGLFFFDSEHLYEEVTKSAIVTHTHPLGIDGAAVLAKGISMVVPMIPDEQEESQNWDYFIFQLQKFAKTVDFKKKLETIKELSKKNEALKIASFILGADITAHRSVPFALYSFIKNPYSFEDCLIDSILISEDRDTIGAMVGGLLGSFLGIQNIPSEWKNKLEDYEYIEEVALELITLKEQKNDE
ncbi:MAG: ADP-ribosylglycohydrolase family protein [Candidatus Heimdallarchaeota archaeon]|nr:ADP-ribosylglycohydrolase family protein [Candidatus Heimdallarchaeota archaeon]MCK4878943.1 ADP-ribosylglycohydrolase family protein [Candidatus Heimdallarchaeota archaeon]